ncbi:carboxypeptidase-like regulatory domain-containing protein [Pararhodonellum marinum]|uniref:carboxypeptidase-like regulatory domain-containing protein n=1 Tax=Pararhodonellum marinum TaxID=2755358 RepID=UPI001E5BB151|nr:carboxypeptidase-like regulatory domain-containing protein [Pararhodonellum marinum]
MAVTDLTFAFLIRGFGIMVALPLFFLTLLPVRAQEVPVLERKVSINAAKERADIFLNRLSKEAGCIFSYSSAAIDAQRPVTGNFTDQPLREVLEIAFQGEVDMKQKGVYVILTPKPASKKEMVFSGYVVDESTGKGLRDVTVYDPITLKSSTTDAYGFFELTLKNPAMDSIQLVVNKKDYSDTLLVKGKQSPFQKILLKTSEVDLEEVGRSITKPMKDFWLWTKNPEGFTNLENVSDTIHRRFQLSLLPFIGTNRKLSGNVVNDYSLNILGGFSGGTNKVELGGWFNLNKGNVQYVQWAGLFNQVGGSVKGLQMAGLANGALGNVEAVQMAGLINFTTGQVKGLQMAGILNLATNEVKGVQMAGIANYSHRDLEGVQLAGVLNVGRNVRGSQIALFNYADSIKGVPIGLISFVRKGYHQVEIGADEVLPVNISLRTGTRSFYNMIFAGVRPEEADSTTWAFGYGVGTSPRLGKKLFLNLELSASQMNKGNVAALNLVNKAYLGLEYQIVKGFGIYFGPSLNWRVYDSSFMDHPELFTYTKPNIQNESTLPADNIATQLWIGGRAGLRFF